MYNSINTEKMNINEKRNFALELLNDKKNDYYAGLRNIARYFSIEEMLQIFDYKTIKSIFGGTNSSHEYKLFVILMEKDANATVRYALQNDEIFDEMFKDRKSVV